MEAAFKLCQVLLPQYYERLKDIEGLYISLCVFNGLLSFTAIVGNVVIIFALKRASSIPSPARILMLCLAVTDLCNGVFVHPLYIALILKIQQQFSCENISEILLVFFILGTSSITMSFNTVIFIGVDRLLAILLHLRYKELITPGRVKLAMACSWILSITIIFFCVFYNLEFGEIAMVCFGYCGLLLLTIVYGKVFLVARHHAANINSQAQTTIHLSRLSTLAQNRNLAIKTFYVYIVFVLCNCPYFITETVLINSDPDIRIQTAIHLTTILLMLNSSLNPLIFAWKLKEIRQIVKNNFKMFIFFRQSENDS
ncbi:adenosine receptor A3-like [Montipora capricornis]|uniref:adenosine receptor A3-like n=1 Tax=Montipora capricornis TaxID=246305 RepID=UPI0035F1F9C4